MRRSMCVISEDVSLPLDEGIKIFAHSLIQSWRREHRVLGISVRPTGKQPGGRTIVARVNRFFISARLWAISRRFHPEVVCYVPSASATIFSFLRSRMIKLYWPSARIVMVSLQPRRYSRLTRLFVPFLAPDWVFVQDEASMKRLLELACKVEMLPSGVDLDRFRPVSPLKKIELRTKYRLDPNAFTVLHIGHIKTERNVELLAQVRQRYNAQVVLVGSRLGDKDRIPLANRLREQGVVVLDRYIKDVQELYQLADCYLFPVFVEGACIGTPLSVLEAMACNLPVVTVRFGSLPTLFKEGQGLFFADTPEGLLKTIGGIKKNNGYQTRGKVLRYSWHNVATAILTANRGRSAAMAAKTGRSGLTARALYEAPPDTGTKSDTRTMIAFLKRNKYPLSAVKDDDYLGEYLNLPEFKAACEDEANLLNDLRKEYIIVRDRWLQAGIECMLIKSGGLTPSFPYLSDNLDVLVKQENGKKARKILRELGYIELRNIEEPQKFLFRKFSGGQSVSAIHLHTEVGWLVGFMDEAALWQRCQVAPDDEKVTIPSPEDTILITAAHSFYENKRFRLGDIARMRECWRRSSIDWSYIESVARKRGWLDGLHFCLLTAAWLEKKLWGTASIPRPVQKSFRDYLKHQAMVYRYYRKLVPRAPVTVPFNFSFLFSKMLYYKKILFDRDETPGTKLFNVIQTLTIGLKLKSGIRPRPSLLVSFSGPDGSGKTQLAQALAQALTTSELKPKYYWKRCGASGVARFFSGVGKLILRHQPDRSATIPGAPGRGERLQNPLFRLVWSYLSAADMIVSYFIQVRLPLLFGKIIICDRYVYDAAAEMEDSLPQGDILNRLAIKLMLALAPRPDAAYLLDIPEEVCARRKNDNTDPDYLRRQRKAYFELAGRYDLVIKKTDREFRPTADEIVSEVMTPYLDNFETWLNALFLANSSQLNPGRESAALKVLFLTNMYPTEEMPSFGTFVQDQAEALRREGVDVDVLLVNGRKKRFNYLWGILRFWVRIFTRRYDVIHAHYFYSGIIARLQFILPVVLTHHGPEVFMTWERFPARWITPFMDKVILVSPEQKRRMHHKTAAVIPCGVNFNAFHPVPRDEARKKLHLPPDKKLVLWAGEHFRPVKRWDIVQAAVAEAKKKDPLIELVLLSGKPHAEVPMYMNACDVLLLVSDGEGSPMVIKEAMACNLPVVAFPTGDVAEVVKGTDGCHLCSQDPVEVAGKLCLALKKPRRSNGREKIARMEQGNIAREIIAVYRETIKKGKFYAWRRWA